jgi:hypothetical protein
MLDHTTVGVPPISRGGRESDGPMRSRLPVLRHVCPAGQRHPQPATSAQRRHPAYLETTTCLDRPVLLAPFQPSLTWPEFA